MSTQAPSPPRQRTIPQPHTTHERCPELDWLRTVIVLGIIPYHAVVLYSATSATVIRHAIPALRLPIFYTSLEAWGIPLIFLLAGAASKFSLDTRSPGTYIRERFLRLLAPAILVALLFVPLRAYYLLLSDPRLVTVSPRPISHPEQLQHIGTFFQYYLTSLFTTGSPIVVRNPLAHLWFVPRLLAASVICVPLFLFLRDRWPRWMARIASSRLAFAVTLLAGALLPAALIVLLQPGWLNRLTAGIPLSDDWAAFSLDLVLFVYGYLIYSSARLRAAARLLAYPALLLAAVCWGVVFAIRLYGHVPPNDYSPDYILFTAMQVFAIWLLAVAVLGLAIRYLSRSTTWQPYLTAATFPIYVLHLPVLIIAAYYLQALPLPGGLQLLLVTVVTLAISFALYEYVIRRIPVTRFLFGLTSPQAKAWTAVKGIA